MSNPFHILSLDRAASKRDILARVAAALRDGRHEARVIAQAQKTLFDPIARAAAEFEYCLDPCAGRRSCRPSRPRMAKRRR